MVSSFFHLWDVGCLIVFFHPMMSRGLLVGLCWVSCLAGVSVGEVPQKKRPFGGCCSPLLEGKTEEGKLKQFLKFDCWV